jgi:hypothetical protein
MSTFVDLLPRTLEEVSEPEVMEAVLEEPGQRAITGWNPDAFAEEQIRGLIRQIFIPGWPRPAHQVVFSAVDSETDISAICMQVGLALSAHAKGTTCLVEANADDSGLEEALAHNGLDLIPNSDKPGTRDSTCRLSNELWLVSRNVFRGENNHESSGPWLRERLAELRLAFDYTVIYGPPAGCRSEAALLASLCDGIVLVVEANVTRKVAAQKAKEKLQAANARLLGTILSERTFPIPEAIYSRL